MANVFVPVDIKKIMLSENQSDDEMASVY